MKKIASYTLSAVLSLTGWAMNAAAHEDDEGNDEPVYETRDNRVNADDHQVFDHRRRGDGLGDLQRQVYHLNQMFDHVDNLLRRSRADQHTWQEYRHLRAESNALNAQFRRGEQYYNRSRLRAQIAHMHDELHQIEQGLRVPASQYYRW